MADVYAPARLDSLDGRRGVPIVIAAGGDGDDRRQSVAGDETGPASAGVGGAASRGIDDHWRIEVRPPVGLGVDRRPGRLGGTQQAGVERRVIEMPS